MREIFCERRAVYNLRNNNEFMVPRVRTTIYGTETIKYRGQRLWLSLPQHIRNAQTINEFKRKLKAGMAPTVHANYAGRSCHSLVFCNSIVLNSSDFYSTTQ